MQGGGEAEGRVAAVLDLQRDGQPSGGHGHRQPAGERMRPFGGLRAVAQFEDGAVVDAAALIEKGILHDCKYGLKVLGNGSVTKKVTVKAAAFSESAKEKIEKAGGKAEVV